MIGELDRLPLREVWKHEALDFTRWLEDNLDVLNEVIDVTLCRGRLKCSVAMIRSPPRVIEQGR
jgi:hypothetical protein